MRRDKVSFLSTSFLDIATSLRRTFPTYTVEYSRKHSARAVITVPHTTVLAFLRRHYHVTVGGFVPYCELA